MYSKRYLVWLLIKSLLGLALLASSGCAAESADYYGDARFSTEEREAIEVGSAWLAAQAGVPAPSIVWTYEPSSSERLPKTIRREVGPAGQGECVGGIGGTVYLGVDGDPRVRAPAVSREILPGFAAHELAHCTLDFADAYHASDAKSDGIMRVLFPMRWTDAERAQCARTGKCGPQ